MSLDYDLNNVEGWRDLYDGDGMVYPYVSLIHYLMVVGIGTITTKNVDEVFQRLTVIQAVDGPLLRDRGISGWFTRAHVERLIGLKTNIYPTMTRRKFELRMGAVALQLAIAKHKQVLAGEVDHE